MESGQIFGRLVPNGDRPLSAIARRIEESHGIRDKKERRPPTTKVHVRGIPARSSETLRLPVMREVREGYAIVEGGLSQLLSVVQSVVESKRGANPK
ncbi:MAG TPA: hypothetical protein VND99_04360 [Candidatus Acidoferrales bacterium]|nr:hypothetical protein [Candidatus Acidoferrales bacterium]